MPNIDQIKSTVIEALSTSMRGPDAARFINIDQAVRTFKVKWIYGNDKTIGLPITSTSGSHLFLFFKNLHVTNVSRAELSALLKQKTFHRGTTDLAAINFFSDIEYTEYLTHLLESLWPVADALNEKQLEETIQRVADAIASEHGRVFESTVILDTYFTTAVVHIPQCLQSDIAAIVYESGYIQSAGHALYIRRAHKADEEELDFSLKEYVDGLGIDKKVFLTPYADEVFSNRRPGSRRNNRSMISVRNGLDGVMLQLRKFHVNTRSLRDYLSTIDERVVGVVAARGLASDEREEADADDSRTIWFISDFKPVQIDETYVTRARDPHLMVYGQYISNQNQFIGFKERKPSWLGPVTLPHTLSIAMVNVGRTHLSDELKPKVIVDPFCGSGTTLIDAALRIKNVAVYGLDKNRLMPQCIRDNLEFFALSTTQIKSMADALNGITSSLDEAVSGSNRLAVTPISENVGRAGKVKVDELDLVSGDRDVELQNAITLILNEIEHAASAVETARAGNAIPANLRYDEGIQELLNSQFSAELIERLSSDASIPLRQRLIISLTWRAMVNGRYSLRGETALIHRILLQEFREASAELSAYASILGWADRPQFDHSTFKGCRGRYSTASKVAPEAIRGLIDNFLPIAENELAGSLKNPRAGIYVATTAGSQFALEQFVGKADLVITDPPYGFNTSEASIFEMQSLFGKFVSSVVRSLNHGGQFLCALPAYSRNGRQIPYFETRAAICRQFIASAEQQSRRVVNVVETHPAPKSIYSAPFYWSSAAAVARSILWFRVE